MNNASIVTAQMRAIGPQTLKATRSALNKIGEQSRTLTLRLLNDATGVTQTKLRPYVRLDRADYSDLTAKVVVRPHVFNIASVGGRQTKKGVSSAAWGKRKIYPHTFLVRGVTAFVRVGKARLPIKPVYGPRIHAEFAKDTTIGQLQTNVREKFPAVLKHELEFALGKYGLGVQ